MAAVLSASRTTGQAHSDYDTSQVSLHGVCLLGSEMAPRIVPRRASRSRRYPNSSLSENAAVGQELPMVVIGRAGQPRLMRVFGPHPKDERHERLAGAMSTALRKDGTYR